MTTLALVWMLAQADGAAAATARPVDDVLVRLVELARGGESPKVSLYLDGGAQVTGELRDIAGDTVLLVEADASHWVLAESVIAVTVHSAGAGQKIAGPARVLSKLDVQRRSEELGRAVSEALGGSAFKLEVVWKDLPESGAGLSLVAAALAETADGVLAAARDDAARRDLARRLKRVKLADASRPGASFSGDTLTVGVTPGDGAAGRPSALEVRRALLAP